MSANPEVKIALLTPLTNMASNLNFNYATTTPQTLVEDAAKHIGCQPLYLTSRVITNTSTKRISMLFAFDEKGTMNLPEVKLEFSQKILEETRAISYEGYRVYGTEKVSR